MHKRDNRRSFPSHHEVRSDSRDPRELRWSRNGAGHQVMELDGRSVAEVRPFGVPRYDMLGELVQPHIARILAVPDEHQFNTCDAARLFCEARLSAAA